MGRPANPARGEVALTIDGENYVLAGTYGNMARLQGAVGVTGLRPLLTMLIQLDARALYEGVRCLAIEGDVKKLDTAVFHPTVAETQQAIVAAIQGPPDPDLGNAPGAGETVRN